MLAHALSGWAAMALSALSMGLKRDQILRVLNIIACLLWATHNALMAAWAAAFMCLFACVMVILGMLGARRTVLVMIGINACLVVPALLSTTPLLAVLPVLGGLFMNIGVSILSGAQLRMSCALGLSFWMAFGFVAESLPVFATNAVAVLVLGVRAVMTRGETKRPASRSL